MKSSKRIFLLSFLLFWACGLSLSASPLEFFITDEIRQELNSLQSEKLQLMNNYNLLSIQYQPGIPNSKPSMFNLALKSRQRVDEQLNSQESSTELQELLNQGWNLFDQFDSQAAELLEQLANSEITILDLQTLLSQAKETIRQLSENLAKAQMWADQMGLRLQENNEDLASAYKNIDVLTQQNTMLKNEAEKMRKQAGRIGLIGFGFAGIGFGVGTPLIIEGILSDNQTMVWSGAGTIAFSGAVWAVGHYLFGWW